MKLTEIFGAPTALTVNRDKGDLNKPSRRGQRIRYAQKHEAGSYGSVMPHKTEIATVVKSNPVAYTSEEDPYYQFVEYITAHDSAEDNLYIPRVYGVHKTVDAKGKLIYKVNMEHLIEFGDIQPHELIAAFLKMGADIDFTAYSNSRLLGFLTTTTREYCTFRNIHSNTLRKVGGAEDEYETLRISDKKFYAALDIWILIKKQSHDINFTWDVRGHNMMWRQTSTGKQLVFTDLLSNTGSADMGADF